MEQGFLVKCFILFWTDASTDPIILAKTSGLIPWELHKIVGSCALKPLSQASGRFIASNEASEPHSLDGNGKILFCAAAHCNCTTPPSEEWFCTPEGFSAHFPEVAGGKKPSEGVQNHSSK